MQNSARLQQLGISANLVYPNISAISQEKNKRYQRTREDSGSEYDPQQDHTAEGDISDGSEGSKRKASSKTNQASEDVFCGVRFQSRKRVCAPLVTTTSTKSSNAQPGASMPASGIPVPPPTLETVVNFAECTQPVAEDDGGDAIAHSNGHIPMAHEDDGGDANPQSETVADCTQLAAEDNFDQHEYNNTVVDSDNQMIHEGAEVPWNRGNNMGHGLQRINRAHRGKLPIIIPEGHTRPLTPVIAAKFATECNIAVRGHVPILIHWKDYKKRPALIDKYLGCLRAKFDINTEDTVVNNGCIQMMKSAIRQQRHRLKEVHFDPFPLHLVRRTSPVTSTSDEEWLQLVESWKTDRKMEACQKNKDNRAKVKFPATTGSCSYPVFVGNLGDDLEGKEPNAFELFKLCHFSKKTQGYTPTVQLAIDEMQNQISAPQEEGEEPRSATAVVASVLDESTKKNMFLLNVGIQTQGRRSSVQNLQAQLEVEKMANVDLRGKVNELERK
ncbi:hypothetical protein ACP4OV_031174 [Aristida adscensionis]